MSEYTSTFEGFQRSLEMSLNGPAEETAAFTEALSLPTFYQVMNGQRIEHDAYVKHVAEWRAKVSDYKPVLHEFLRDGDQLAARMTGSIKVDGAEMVFESFIFAKVEKASGKLEWMIERSVSGPPGGVTEHGAN